MDLKIRLKTFTINTILYTRELPNKNEYWIIQNQLVKSSSSVAANFRASLVARSKREFLSKLQICLEEADESIFWLEVLEGLNWKNSKLRQESQEIKAIIISLLKKHKDNNI